MKYDDTVIEILADSFIINSRGFKKFVNFLDYMIQSGEYDRACKNKES